MNPNEIVKNPKTMYKLQIIFLNVFFIAMTIRYLIKGNYLVSGVLGFISAVMIYRYHKDLVAIFKKSVPCNNKETTI